MAFVELMRAEPAAAGTLIEQFGDPKVAQRMLYLLAITDCLEPYAPASQQKLKAVRAASPPKPRKSTPPGPRASMRAPKRQVSEGPVLHAAKRARVCSPWRRFGLADFSE